MQLVWLVIILSLIWLALLQLQYFRFFKRFSLVLHATKGQALEELLIEHMKDLKRSLAQIEKAEQAYTYLEAMTTRSVQKVGLVRFNPFHDTGSDQSFSLALLDLYDNGVVVSSIHGREGTRIYAKPVRGGESGNYLSEEELQAITEAQSAGEAQRRVAAGVQS